MESNPDFKSQSLVYSPLYYKTGALPGIEPRIVSPKLTVIKPFHYKAVFTVGFEPTYPSVCDGVLPIILYKLPYYFYLSVFYLYDT